MTVFQFSWRSLVAFPIVWIAIAIPSFFFLKFTNNTIDVFGAMSGGIPHSLKKGVMGTISLSGVIVLPMSLIIGFPAHIFLWRKKMTSMKNYFFCGCCGGLIAGFLLMYSFYKIGWWDYRIAIALISSVIFFAIGSVLVRFLVYFAFGRVKSENEAILLTPNAHVS